MAYSLVGSAGAVTLGSADAAVTPAWDAGASRTAGNLLILLLVGFGSGSLPGTPTGWRNADTGGGTFTVGIFYKIAAGGDTAPTVAGIVGMTWAVQLLEFSGNASAPLDKHATASSGSSPFQLPSSSTDATAGEVVVWAVAEGSAVITGTMASAPNNGMTAHDVTNNGTSTANHYLFSWGITTVTSAADVGQVTVDAGGGDTTAGAIASFKLPPSPQSNVRARV